MKLLNACIYLCGVVAADAATCLDPDRVQFMSKSSVPLTNRWLLSQAGVINPGQALSFYGAQWRKSDISNNGTIQCHYATSWHTPDSDVTTITYYHQVNDHAVLTWLPESRDTYSCYAPRVSDCSFDEATPPTAVKTKPQHITTFNTAHHQPSVIKRQPPQIINQHLEALRLMTLLTPKMLRGFRQFATDTFPATDSYTSCLMLWHAKTACHTDDQHHCATYQQLKTELGQDQQQQQSCLAYMGALSKTINQHASVQNERSDQAEWTSSLRVG